MATVLLAAVIGMPTLASPLIGSVELNIWTAWLQFVFVVVLLPETIRGLRRFKRSKLAQLAAVTWLLCGVSWILHQGIPVHSRVVVYPVLIALFFVAVVSYFSERGSPGFQLAFWVKFGVTSIGLVILGAAIAYGGGQDIFVRPPIYRHLRHANYDWVIVIALAWFFLQKESRVTPGGVLTFFALGYFSFWSGGRGEFLALAMAAIVLVTYGRLRITEPSFYGPGLVFAIGGLAVVATGQTEFLYDRLARSVSEGADAISSGRLRIWKITLSRAAESSVSILFGFGPDAFIRLGVFNRIGAYITHPHNAVVQWVLEFGVLGTLTLLLLIRRAVKLAIDAVRARPVSDTAAAGALVIGMLGFAMVDGIFYHAAPLTYMLILLAYLLAQAGRTTGDEIPCPVQSVGRDEA